MCKNIVDKKKITNRITVYDIVRDRGENLRAQLGQERIALAASAAAAASDADIVFYMLPNDEVVATVLKEISKNDIKGKIIVDCSTVHPDTSRWETSFVSERGAKFVACPVFGSAVMSEAGQLIAVPSGEKDAVEIILPFCTGVMSRDTIELLGEEPAKATLLKLTGNTFILNMVGALSEGHVLAEKAGLGPEQLHRFIEKLFPGPYTAYSQRMVSGDYWQRKEPLGLVELALKDARHAKRIADESGMRMRLVEVVQGYLEQVLALRGSNAEFVSAYGAKRVESGLAFENDGLR